MPRPGAASTVRRSAWVPARWPAMAGRPRRRAQRPLPSMMMATAVADSGSGCSTDESRRSLMRRRRRPTAAAGMAVFKPIRDGCRAGSERAVRLVAAGRRADADEREAVGARVRTAGGLRVEPDEGAVPDRNVLSVDRPVAAAGDHDGDLFLAGGGLVVLLAGRVGRQVEAVDSERLDAQLPAHEARGAAGAARLDVIDVAEGGGHAAPARVAGAATGGRVFLADERLERRGDAIAGDIGLTSDRRVGRIL